MSGVLTFCFVVSFSSLMLSGNEDVPRMFICGREFGSLPIMLFIGIFSEASALRRV
ncbi:unknown [Bacteroides sp. CAG:462]|nr:unknown [Bacteroides sp. CAG:462]